MQSKLLHEADGQRIFAVILATGDEVLSSLQEFVEHENIHAATFTAIGALSDAVLNYFNWEKKEYEKIPVREQVEVAALIGDVADDPKGKPTLHIHIVLGTRDGSAKAGHLGEGHVRPTLEVIVTESPAHLRKVKDDETGLALIGLPHKQKVEQSLTRKVTSRPIPLPEAMEARAVSEIPRGGHWQYEPKWDGFRCILRRYQDAATMRSKSGQDLGRYFPEITAAAVTLPESDYVLDGELVIPAKRGFSFDNLLQRIHPAESRIRRLAVETPALYIAFDLLVRNGIDLAGMKLSDRRRKLEDFAKKCFAQSSTFRLSPASTKLTDARRWLKTNGGGTDGVMAKRLDLPYQAGNREGMQKIKMHRTADCVVGGFRYGERPQSAGKGLIGSLLLGLYDDEGLLHHVGFTSGIKAAEKKGLTEKLEKIKAERSFTGNTPGAPSRWSTKRSSEWVPVRPKFVVEVSYDHFSGGRFRHGTTIVRWRPDKRPTQCTMDQLKTSSRGIRL